MFRPSFITRRPSSIAKILAEMKAVTEPVVGDISVDESVWMLKRVPAEVQREVGRLLYELWLAHGGVEEVDKPRKRGWTNWEE